MRGARRVSLSQAEGMTYREQVESLKAYGNAIVPQVAAEIMRAIRTSEAQP